MRVQRHVRRNRSIWLWDLWTLKRHSDGTTEGTQNWCCSVKPRADIITVESQKISQLPSSQWSQEQTDQKVSPWPPSNIILAHFFDTSLGWVHSFLPKSQCFWQCNAWLLYADSQIYSTKRSHFIFEKGTGNLIDIDIGVRPAEE